MPRIYTKQNKRVNYSLNVLKLALAEVRRGSTLRDVSERYNVPRSTLGKSRSIRNLDNLHVGAKTFVAQITEMNESKNIYKVSCLRIYKEKRNVYIFPVVLMSWT